MSDATTGLTMSDGLLQRSSIWGVLRRRRNPRPRGLATFVRKQKSAMMQKPWITAAPYGHRLQIYKDHSSRGSLA